MSVIIHGMNMPKNCYDCLFERLYYTSVAQNYCMITGKNVGSCDRPSWCPLVEMKGVEKNEHTD